MQISTRIGVVQAMAFPFDRILTGGSVTDYRTRKTPQEALRSGQRHVFVMAAAITAPHTRDMGISAEKSLQTTYLTVGPLSLCPLVC
jgi:hypothetical protein